MRKARIGLELFRAAIKLPRVADDHSGAAMHWPDDSTYVHVLAAVFEQLADHFAVSIETDESEDAFFIRRVGRADVEITRAVGEFDDIIDVG